MKIGIVFGGKSYEHEISIVSAIAMKDVISHNLVFIFCDQDRTLYHIPTDNIKSKLFSSGEFKKCDILTLNNKAFTKKSFLKDKKLDIDVVLNLTHGADGEDGLLSSLFEFYSIPYIGPRKGACAISFNKFLTKGYASSLGVKTIDYKYFTKDDEINIDMYPVIVKPVTLGSSIGVSIVKNKNELEYALDVAFEFDNAVIIESFISGIKEYNLAGCKVNNKFIFSMIEEPQKTEILDFDKKYLDFARTSSAVKAELSSEMEVKVKNTFKKVYNNTFDGALIRCDLFIYENDVYLNEINPIPGSMANYLFEDFSAVLTSLISDLPKPKDIEINYEYVNKIQGTKGK